jgi:hypothetical protein
VLHQSSDNVESL